MNTIPTRLGDLIATRSRVDSFDDGLTMVATDLTLELLHAEPREVENTRATTAKSLTVDGTEVMDSAAIRRAIGERYVPRRTTKTVATGTIYGPAGELDCTLRQTSIFGLNPQMLTSDGTVNPVAVVRRMREIAPAFGLRETRLNYLFNQVITRDFYENYVTLCFAFLQRIALCEMYAKNKRYTRALQLPAEALKRIVTPHRLEDSAAALRTFVTMHQHGAGIAAENSWLLTTADNLRTSYRNAALSNDHSFKNTHTVSWEEWHIFQYDDGHSVSGVTTGDRFGFSNGRLIIDPLWNRANDSPVNTTRGEAAWPENDDTIKLLAERWGWLNVSGMSARDVQVLDTVLNGNVRKSPFFVDQTFQILPPKKMVTILHAPTWVGADDVITRDDLVRVYRILIANHRIHEDALAATSLIEWWMALPGPETVQSWQWFNNDFVMSLPAVGFRRAYISPLTEGDGVGLTEDALASYTSLQSGHVEMLWSGLLLQTAWAWGEYLMYYNQPALEQMIIKMMGAGALEIPAFERAGAFASAVLGRALHTVPFDRTGMRIVGGVESSFSKLIEFGQLADDVVQDTGYERSGTAIRFKSIAVPGCLSLVVGLGGTLMRNTPYANVFEIKEGARFFKGGVFRTAVNYEDLWAAGVVSRWQGYDMYYATPNGTQRHVMYAANNVGVALPPRGPQTLDAADLYILRGLDERAITFGTRYDPRLAIRCRYAWRRTVSLPLRKPVFTSECCEYVRTDTFTIREMRISTGAAANYKLYVYGTYDLQNSSFQISVVTAGAGLRSAPAPITRGEVVIPEVGTTLQHAEAAVVVTSPAADSVPRPSE